MEGKPKQYTEAEIKHLLVSTEGVRVIEHESVLPPASINYEGLLSDEYPKMNDGIKRVIGYCVDAGASFLSGPIILDQFTEHRDRRQWRIEMNKKYGDAMSDFYTRNKLRINTIASVHLAFMALASKLRTYKVRSEKANAAQALINQFPDMGPYDTYSSEEKITFVSKIDEICTSLLTLLSREEGGA